MAHRMALAAEFKKCNAPIIVNSIILVPRLSQKDAEPAELPLRLRASFA